jgi:P27 family predicted phage terminase small subunit
MGRTALPTDVKAAQGTLRRCRENRTVLAVDGKLPVEPPAGLTKDARAAWTMAVSCCPDGTLTAIDHGILERWARNYALYRKLMKTVDAEGVLDQLDPTKMSATFNALIKVEQQLMSCERELGFTPVSRTRVRACVREENAGNPFAE